MRNTSRFTIRMNASTHSITDSKDGHSVDLSTMDNDKLTTVANAVSVASGIWKPMKKAA